jgi:hypothetical protein
MKKALAFWWSYFWVMTIQNPKSTFSGLFSGIGLVAAGSLEYIPATDRKPVFILVVTCAVCKIMVKAITSDTGKQYAKLPGETEPQMVTSTEVPTNPYAKPIAKP